MNDIESRISSSFFAQGLMKTLGATLMSVSEGEVRISLPFSAALSQQQGFAHAGVITSIVDNACGYAALTKAPEGHDVVTAEFKVNFLRPAIGTSFVAVGKVVNAGRLLTVCTGEVFAIGDAQSAPKLIAVMQATIATVSSKA
ncbi:PaaI family thioesterase [Caballeronia sp. GAWG1-1]|uniref:PaaI family thioesterase n=1 Tax=Caballeronia sp. GAWG1-1 TaxID=2921742 RepID=UPI00202927C4|nr:PaaI family thioesterase [Caballeronia sp. GAWG1-1]